ncbi:alpha/beta fold hydrolase [Streptomyces sp. NBC_01483]|uniref:alpha/beta fold hydrolase n=1 Tax=Streptomyces sp. NBC_01483 TaxID=2903883 RepID=UPI002E2EEE2A|nr:alpha/beta fold hydrolase [Streptomyces sp. NBC_01483]
MQPVVLLHGLIGPFADERAVTHLRPAVVLSPDLLGYGPEADVNPQGITIDAQVEYMRTTLDTRAPNTRVHLVGHSVGGVIAASFAHGYPDRVESFVNVEGNFALADAFWSTQVATQTLDQVNAMLEADRADPARWLRESGVEPTGDRIRSAAEALAYQPAGTIQVTARAVVEYTGLTAGAVKSRPIRSGAFAAAGSATVVRCRRRRRTPASPMARMTRATRLWFTAWPPPSRSWAVTLGTP